MELLAAFAELLIAALTGLIHLTGSLIYLLVSASWLAAHRRGLRRAGHGLVALASAYLLFGIARFFVPALATPSLQFLYGWGGVIAAILAIIIGLALAEGPRPAPGPAGAGAGAEAENRTERVAYGSGLLALFVFLVLVFGLLSGISTQRHEQNLQDRLCAEAESRIDPDLMDLGREGADRLGRLMDRDLSGPLDCEEN